MFRFFSDTLYGRWVIANALGEMIGLGATFAVGAWFFLKNGEGQNTTMILAAFAVAVSSGVIEATVVGLGQWWALHPWFAGISRSAWWLATLLGAELAYILGYLPSTLISLGEQAAESTQPASEPAQWVVLLLAAGMGAVGGAVLSFAQWLVLRKVVQGAGIWIPANMLGWLLGMPMIFWAIDTAQASGSVPAGVIIMAVALFLTGAVVGAVHGRFLVRLAEQNSLV